jgi:hypothetical protein
MNNPDEQEKAALTKWRKRIRRGKIRCITYRVAPVMLYALAVWLFWINKAVGARPAFAIFINRVLYTVARIFTATPGCYRQRMETLYTAGFFVIAAIILGVAVLKIWKHRYWRINRRLACVFPHSTGRNMTLKKRRWSADREYTRVYIVKNFGRSRLEFMEEFAKERLKIAIKAAHIHDFIDVDDTIHIHFIPKRFEKKRLEGVFSRVRYY